MADRPLLLDTHVWVWTVEKAEGELSGGCLSLLDEGSREGRLRVSAISVWEVAMLEARGRLKLATECGAWVELALRAPGIALAPLDPGIAVASTRLAGIAHRDPVDRILIATARVNGWTLVTRDRRILDYARSGHIRVIDAGARTIRERAAEWPRRRGARRRDGHARHPL